MMIAVLALNVAMIQLHCFCNANWCAIHQYYCVLPNIGIHE